MTIDAWIASVVTAILAWLCTWIYYRKGVQEARGTEQRITNSLTGITAYLEGSPRDVDSRLRDLASRADLSVPDVRKVLATLRDDEIAETTRRVLNRLQGPDGTVQRSELVKEVGLPPQALGDLFRVIEMMRQSGEVEYIGDFCTTTSLRYRPTARKHQG